MFLAFFVCGNKRNHYKNRKRYFLFLLQLVVFVLWVHTHLSLHTYISVNAGYYIQYMRWLFLLCPKVTCRDVFFSFLGETQHSNEVSLMYVIQYIFNNQNNKNRSRFISIPLCENSYFQMVFAESCQIMADKKDNSFIPNSRFFCVIFTLSL